MYVVCCTVFVPNRIDLSELSDPSALPATIRKKKRKKKSGTTRTHQDLPGLTKNYLDIPEPIRTYMDLKRPTWTNQGLPGPIRT